MLVNQKLSFAKLMVGELERDLLPLSSNTESPEVFTEAIRKNRRLYQARFEAVMHHLCAAFQCYLHEIDAFDVSGKPPTAEASQSFRAIANFKALIQELSNNPGLEELKNLYHNRNSVVRVLVDFSELLTQEVLEYQLPDQTPDASAPFDNIIAVELSNSQNETFKLTLQQMVGFVDELRELIASQRAMSVEQ